jgi:hypothetical protein
MFDDAGASISRSPNSGRPVWGGLIALSILLVAGAVMAHRSLGGIAHEVDTLGRRAIAARIALELDIAFSDMRRAAALAAQTGGDDAAAAFRTAGSAWRERLDEGHAAIRGAERRQILRRVDEEAAAYGRDVEAGDADGATRRGRAVADNIAAIKGSATADHARIQRGLERLIERTQLIGIVFAIAGLATLAGIALLIRRASRNRPAPPGH